MDGLKRPEVLLCLGYLLTYVPLQSTEHCGQLTKQYIYRTDSYQRTSRFHLSKVDLKVSTIARALASRLLRYLNPFEILPACMIRSVCVFCMFSFIVKIQFIMHNLLVCIHCRGILCYMYLYNYWSIRDTNLSLLLSWWFSCLFSSKLSIN